MKKIFALLITLTMLFVLASCGQETSETTTSAFPAPPAEENVATVPVGCEFPLNIFRGGEASFKEAGLSGSDYFAPSWNFTEVDFDTAGEYPATVSVATTDNMHSWTYGFTVRVEPEA